MARIRGVQEVRRAVRRAGPALTAELHDELERTAREMHTTAMRGFDTASDYAQFWHGRQGMQNLSGNARRYYRWSVQRTALKARVGLLSSTAQRSAFYLRFFNDGTVNQPARPVHDEAFEAQRFDFERTMPHVLNTVLTRLNL